MAYRKILVPLLGNARDTHVLNAAFDIAQAFGSHVAGMFVRTDPAEVLPFLGEGVSASVIQEIMDTTRAASERGAKIAQATLASAAKEAGAPTAQPPGEGLGASFHVREGISEDVIGEEVRLADLIIFDAPADSKDVASRTTMENALLNGRTPVLLVPHKRSKLVGGKIGIGWDGGAAAAFAVSASLPLLKRASSIEVINVTSGGLDTLRMDRLRDYLRLQGLSIVEHGINPGGQGVGAALVDGAERAGVDMLVIGGYGHSRLRELVLGGVTRHVLAHVSMPILMAH